MASQMPIEDILIERQKVHGDFADNASIAQRLKEVVHDTSFWDSSLTLIQKEAVDNILQKIGRLISGDSYFDDHWLDIQGYAGLALREIESVRSP